MAAFVPIALYLQIAEVSQYESAADIAYNEAFKGGDINRNYTQLLRAVRRAVQWGYNWNPNFAGLPAAAIFMYQLCGKYVVSAQNTINNLTQALPIVTGPNNQSVNVGASATFTIAVTSSLSYSIRWYKNFILIPGATGLSYTLLNAQLSDSTAQFSAIVTNGAGSTTSATGVLTVTAALIGYFTYSPTVDFYSILIGNSDPFSYGTTYSITHNSAIAITLPGGMPANQYMLAKIPVGESIKTIWYNTALNNGSIPDSAFEAIVQFGGFTYYASRGQISLDITQPLTLS